MDNPEKYLNILYEWIVTNGISLLSGILLLIAGL